MSKCRPPARLLSREFTLVELPVVSKQIRAAFTLVELLVIITIIGMLIALLIPAVQTVRENARRTECANHLRNLAQAMTAYESSKEQLPGYSQRVLRGKSQAIGISRLEAPPRWVLITVDPEASAPISWVTKLLPQIERQDIWDQVVDKSVELEVRPIDLLVCPSDDDAAAVADVPALTYSVNAGAPDWDGRFLHEPNSGDTTDNGVFFNVFEYTYVKKKAPLARLSNIRDGATTTIMLSENIHKTYEPFAPGHPSRFSWACGTEQHLGIVWVVSQYPKPGNAYADQERINHVSDDVYDSDPMFDPNLPRFARPSSSHPSGVNVAFCDGHHEFVRDTIEYTVYQQLLTTNGRKSVDPRDHFAGVTPPDAAHPIQQFRNAPPLSESSYR